MIPLYELLYGSKIAKQRVVDDFSGDSLNERWTFTNIAGSGSGAMSDTIDGGYIITTGALINDRTVIYFNDVRHYANPFSIITTFKRNTTDTSTQVGLSDDHLFGSSNWSLVLEATNQSFKSLYTKDGTNENVTATTVAPDTNWTSYQIKGESSTLHKLYINSDFECVRTSQLPTAKMQPIMRVYNIATGAKTGQIRYLEAYNT